jgi:hypothetical protein
MPDIPEVTPALVSAEMGYGHLRAALPLVDAFGTKLLPADQAPLADEAEAALWSRLRRMQEPFRGRCRSEGFSAIPSA